MASAAANAGIGEAAVDPAEPLQRSRHRGFDRDGIADVAEAGIDLAGTIGHGRRRVSVLLGVAAPDRDVAAGSGECLLDAETDPAIAAGDDGHPAGQVENAHERFHLLWRTLGRASDGGQMFLIPSMDKASLKIKYGGKIETPCAAADNAGHNRRGNRCSSNTSHSISMARWRS